MTYVVHHKFKTQDDPRQESSSEIEESKEAHANIGATFGPDIEDGVDEGRSEEVRRFPTREAVDVASSIQTLKEIVSKLSWEKRVKELIGTYQKSCSSKDVEHQEVSCAASKLPFF